jgi:hypothetical protein
VGGAYASMGGDGAGGAGSMAGLGGDGEAAVAMHEERTRCRRAELQARNLRTLAHPRAPPRPAHHRTTAPPHHRTTAVAPTTTFLRPWRPCAPAPLHSCTCTCTYTCTYTYTCSRRPNDCRPNLVQELKSLLTAKLVTDENYVNEVQRVLEKHPF